MQTRLKNKIEGKLKDQALKVLAAAYNTSPVEVGDIDTWYRQCTNTITELQRIVNNATEVVIKDRKETLIQGNEL